MLRFETNIVRSFRQTHVAFLDEGDLIKIDGPPEEADKIRDALEKQAEDLKANMEYVEITVDAKYHKHIIGKGGSTVNRLKQVSSLFIHSELSLSKDLEDDKSTIA